MWKQIAIAGAIGGVILGTGAAALADTGSASSTPSPAAAASSSSPSTAKAGPAGTTGKDGHAKLKIAIGRFEHGSWVSDGKDGAKVTHDAIKGTVTAVSATSISVKSSDGTALTFAVNGSTAVRVGGTGKTTISSVKVNDMVLVAGTKSGSTDTALHVLDRSTK